jgi:hypothetical protein
MSDRKARWSPNEQLASKSRNMARYPMVLKDYDFAAKFARGFRYNEQALVYSELLACGAHSTRKNAAFGLKDRTQ